MAENGNADPAAARAALIQALRDWKAADEHADEPQHEGARDLLDRLEREDRAAIEAARAAALVGQIEALNQKLDQIVTASMPQQEPERRSRMTPARKSQLIRERGLDEYQKLPW
jgi:hypothetical protein